MEFAQGNAGRSEGAAVCGIEPALGSEEEAEDLTTHGPALPGMFVFHI